MAPAGEVFDDILVRGLDKEPGVSAGFNALAPAEQAHVRALLDLRTRLVDSEAATRLADSRHRRWWTILGVVRDAVPVVGRPNLRLFRHQDNLIVSLLFWPLITTAILAATVVTFLT